MGLPKEEKYLLDVTNVFYKKVEVLGSKVPRSHLQLTNKFSQSRPVESSSVFWQVFFLIWGHARISPESSAEQG